MTYCMITMTLANKYEVVASGKTTLFPASLEDI